MPNPQLPSRADRRRFLGLGLAALGGFAVLPGCAPFAGWSGPLMRGQTPDEDSPDAEKKLELVGEYTRPWGLNYVKLESVALVTNLNNTGSSPPPSPQRNQLLSEMQSHEIRNPEKILDIPSNSLVLVSGYIPPAVQKGDTFDVEIRLPRSSDTTSLRGGWLMQSRLRQMEVLGGQIRTGSIDGLAQGDIVIDATFDGANDKIKETRGRVLGGGVALISRPIGLAIRKEDASIRISLLIAAAINARFFSFDRGKKSGVAEPQRDNFMELSVPARYKHSLGRFLRVVRNIPLKENPVERVERLQLLERKLLEPSTAAITALQLEAIGKEGIPALKRGLKSPEADVRFYAAEALAFLDDADAAAPLADAAKNHSAFRWHAYSALTAMDHVSALGVLSDLLHESSAETRYGAFRAIRTRNPDDPGTKGEVIEKKFRYHLVPTTGEPLVHFARSRRPEIVLFGHEQPLKPPSFIRVGRFITLKGQPDGQIKLSRFQPGDENDTFETCPADLDQVIRMIAKLGGGYGDIVRAVHELKKEGCLASRVAVEALPKPGRIYIRDDNEPSLPGEEAADDGNPLAQRTVGTPASELFTDQISNAQGETEDKPIQLETYVDPEYQKPQKKRFLDKLNPFGG